MPNNFVSSFTVMRQKAEKLIEDGYTFKPSENQHRISIDKDLLLKLRSPLEEEHEIKVALKLA